MKPGDKFSFFQKKINDPETALRLKKWPCTCPPQAGGECN
jgi:hypothetical protein